MRSPNANRWRYSYESAPNGENPTARSPINVTPVALMEASCDCTLACSQSWKRARYEQFRVVLIVLVGPGLPVARNTSHRPFHHAIGLGCAGWTPLRSRASRCASNSASSTERLEIHTSSRSINRSGLQRRFAGGGASTADQQRVPRTPGAGVVGAGFLRQGGRRLVQRAEQRPRRRPRPSPIRPARRTSPRSPMPHDDVLHSA